MMQGKESDCSVRVSLEHQKLIFTIDCAVFLKFSHDSTQIRPKDKENGTHVQAKYLNYIVFRTFSFCVTQSEVLSKHY